MWAPGSAGARQRVAVRPASCRRRRPPSHPCACGLRARPKPERSWFDSRGWDLARRNHHADGCWPQIVGSTGRTSSKCSSTGSNPPAVLLRACARAFSTLYGPRSPSWWFLGHPPRVARGTWVGSKRWLCSGFLIRRHVGSIPTRPTMRPSTREALPSAPAIVRWPRASRLEGTPPQVKCCGDTPVRHAGIAGSIPAICSRRSQGAAPLPASAGFPAGHAALM